RARHPAQFRTANRDAPHQPRRQVASLRSKNRECTCPPGVGDETAILPVVSRADNPTRSLQAGSYRAATAVPDQTSASQPASRPPSRKTAPSAAPRHLPLTRGRIPAPSFQNKRPITLRTQPHPPAHSGSSPSRGGGGP